MDMITELFGSYIVLVVMGICLCVGYVIKHVVPGDSVNRFIPVIMALLGVALNVWVNEAITPEVLLGGLASGLASTGAHQALSQFLDKE